MELDQSSLDQFVEEAKAGLAAESELILQTCGKPSAWAAGFLQRPESMDYVEFSAYQDAVGNELVACGVLKPDNRKHRGTPPYNPGRMRVSQSWWRKAQSDGI